MEYREEKKRNQIRNRRVRRMKRLGVTALIYLVLLAAAVLGLLGLTWLMTNASLTSCILMIFVVMVLGGLLFRSVTGERQGSVVTAA